MRAMPPDPGGRRMPRLERDPEKEKQNGVRAEQTVSQMVVESLARQAEALTDQTGRPFEEAFAELADGPHRHQKAAQWQAGLLADRKARRFAHLRELGSAGSRYWWLERYTEWVDGTDGREEYHALVQERFASLKN